MKGSRLKPTPPTIVLMSLRLAIPRRVALQQSPPPLRQPRTILTEKRLFEQKKALNGKCANGSLSQRRGSPQLGVPKVCPGRRDSRQFEETHEGGSAIKSAPSDVVQLRAGRPYRLWICVSGFESLRPSHSIK